MYKKETTVCFTGHRTFYEPRQDVGRKLEAVVRECIENGARTFITGGAIGFDTLAAQLIIRLRSEFPDIILALALPCPPEQQTLRWTDKQKVEYYEILEKADFTKIVSDHYTSECMYARNRLMVDRSGTLICYLRKNKGGTFYTVNYGKEQGIIQIDV
ncbi:MAG: DUF1273 domain-containing protein [Lachnospiraceae bacterium]|nr:DUF1273 domain-containing protein [Ruminococcus sp.]MCM1276410.1 DUF1273 domain-containing protein [Lachnospiraceae bacterium]